MHRCCWRRRGLLSYRVHFPTPCASQKSQSNFWRRVNDSSTDLSPFSIFHHWVLFSPIVRYSKEYWIGMLDLTVKQMSSHRTSPSLYYANVHGDTPEKISCVCYHCSNLVPTSPCHMGIWEVRVWSACSKDSSPKDPEIHILWPWLLTPPSYIGCPPAAAHHFGLAEFGACRSSSGVDMLRVLHIVWFRRGGDSEYSRGGLWQKWGQSHSLTQRQMPWIPFPGPFRITILSTSARPTEAAFSFPQHTADFV